MKDVAQETWSTDVKLALQFGASNFMLFIVNAALFLIAAAVLEQTGAEVNLIFTAIFCMLFGAQQAGQAAGWGPDIGKGYLAAEKIFAILEDPSEINAIEMDAKK